jgi:hypothetical protein
MKVRLGKFMKRFLLSIGVVAVLLVSTTPADAATPRPKFNVGCFDQTNTGSDYRGRYIEYLPTLTANFSGKTASIQIFVNNVQQSTIKYSRNTSSYSNLAFFNAPVKFYKNEVTIGKNSFKFIFQDSKKNKSIWTCETTLYDSSFVYFTSSSYSADFSVYLSSSSYSSDLSVYFTSSSYSANSCGLWYPVSSSYSADFTVYLTSSSYSADFSIYRTSSSYSAGTN